jgi:hypothetical protein
MDDPQKTEQTLLRMKGECEDTIILLNQAPAMATTPEMENLCEQWTCAQSAVISILESLHNDPTRDLSGVMHCVLWFMVVHSGGLDEVKAAVNRAAGPPGSTG